MRWIVAFALVIPLMLLPGCGKSGERETRPIEVAFRVTRPGGVPFQVAALQAANADHRFGERVFESTHLFVMENARQPVSGTFRNLSTDQSVTIEIYFGDLLMKSEPIPPGACCTVSLDEGCAQANDVCPEPAPISMETEVRFEVFSLSPITGIGFTATLGDESATNVTACAVSGDFCRTPATFFIEEARGSISAIFIKRADQDPDTVFQADLFIDGVLRESETDDEDVVISVDL